MKSFLKTVLAIAVTMTVAFTSTGAEPSETEWVNLLKDDSIELWEPGPSNAKTPSKEIGDRWSLKGGVLRLDRDAESGRGGQIWTKKDYYDFELKFEFNIAHEGNSGIKYRAVDAKGRALGCEYQIIDDEKNKDNKNPTHRTACLYELVAVPADRKLNPAGEWNEGRIRVSKNRFEHWLNGEKVVSIEFGSDDWKERFAQSKYKVHPDFAKKAGPIVLTDHGDSVSYRNILIREEPQDREAPISTTEAAVEAKAELEPKPRASAPSFGRQESKSGIRHSFLIAGTPTVLVGEDGEVKWQAKGKARDAFVLENGNVLASIGNKAQEITMDGKVVWSYSLAPENKELGTAVRLESGNTLVVERGVKPRLLEVTREGEIAIEVPLKPDTENAHMQTRMARKLPNGNYLVPHLLAFAVKEYTPDGVVVNTIRTDLKELGGREARNWPFTAIRLQNGRTLVNLTNGNKTVEFDAKGKVAWKVTNEDVAGRFADPCGGQRLANGNTVICSYAQKDPKKPKLFEVTPDKEVVWEFFHPKARAHEVHVLSSNGKPEGALK